MSNVKVWAEIRDINPVLDIDSDALVRQVISMDSRTSDDAFFGRWLDTYLLLEEVMSKE